MIDSKSLGVGFPENPRRTFQDPWVVWLLRWLVVGEGCDEARPRATAPA